MLQTLIGPVTGLLDKFIEDKDQKNALAHEIATLAEKQAHEAAIAQVEVNKQEAQHRSIFVAGWRPFTGWVTAFALAYHFIITPFILFATAIAGIEIPELPSFDMETLTTILLGMLGLGGMRSFEKFKGVSK
jgi:hypothetical protein|tara:strand:+ start:57 stop:452 length:396 start_codon:yes stop_codon:yes gene_type:complete